MPTEMQLEEKIETLVNSQSKMTIEPTRFLSVALPVICFAVAFAVSVVNNLLSQESKIVLIFDSRHYLETARLMVLWWQDALSKGDIFGSLSGLAKTQPWLAEYLVLDGPILPSLGAFVFSLVGKVPQQTDWRVLITMLAFLHATNSLLVFALMQRFVRNNYWGLVAGLSWAFYPAAIVASGRYLTETPAVTLLLASVLCLDLVIGKTSAKKANLATLALGVIDALMLLLKPVLLPAWGLAHLIALASCNWTKRLVVVAMIVAGMSAVLVPWLVTTGVVTGKMQLLPQRVPAYNIAKGCDVEVDGWGAMPSVPLTDIFAGEKSSFDALFGVCTTRSLESFNLGLRKFVRLWSWPWNDFRQHPLGLSMEMQRAWHWLFCLLAAGGAFVLITQARPIAGPASRTANFVGSASLAIVCAHLVYLPFETINRYGFAAMPFMVLLAVYFMYCLLKLGRIVRAALLIIPASATAVLITSNFVPELVALGCPAHAAYAGQLFLAWLSSSWLIVSLIGLTSSLIPKAKHKVAILMLVVGCLTSGAVLSAFAFDNRQALGWSCRLTPGQSVCRTVDLSNSGLGSWGTKRAQGALILLDGDSSMKNALVKVNGQLVEKPVLVSQFRPDNYFVLDTMRKYAATIGFQLDDFRQWYAVSVPLPYLRRGGNVIVVTADSEPLTVFGEYSLGTQEQYPLDLDRFSPGMFCNDGQLLDGRVRQPLSKRCVPSVSSLEVGGFGTYDDLSLAKGKQTGEYHIYLATFFNPDVSGQDLGKGATFKQAYSARDFDPMFAGLKDEPSSISVSNAQFQCARTNTVELAVPNYLVGGSHLLVKVSGKMRAAGKASQFSLLPVAVFGKENPFLLVFPHAPGSIKAVSDWQDFVIEEEIPLAAVRGGLHKIQLGLYPGPWEQVAEYGMLHSYGQTQLKDLSVQLTANTRKNFSGKTPSIF